MGAGEMTAANLGAIHLEGRSPCPSRGNGPASRVRNGAGPFDGFPERPGHHRHGDDQDRQEAQSAPLSDRQPAVILRERKGRLRPYFTEYKARYGAAQHLFAALSGIGPGAGTFAAGCCGRPIPAGIAATPFPWQHYFDSSRNIVDNAGAMV